MGENIFVDTSALMNSLNTVKKEIEQDNIIIICSTVLEELDNLKEHKEENRSFKARQAIRFINKNSENVGFILKDNIPLNNIENFEGFDINKNDNKILYWCIEHKKFFPNTKFLTYDLLLKLKAEYFGIECISTDYEKDNVYKGYIEIEGTEEENDYKLLEIAPCLHANQYVIIKDIDTNQCQAVKFKNGQYTDVLLSKKITPKNVLQSCAIDLMYDKDIPIKIICGGYGSGKTYIAVKSAEDLINKYHYNKLMLVRNPIPADNIDIGALPGTKYDKVGNYFRSMTQYLSCNKFKNSDGEEIDPFNPDNLEATKNRGYDLILEIPSFMKGISVDDTLMIVDECEDLNLKLIKMLGTRIGNHSAIVFTGDWHQAEQQYKFNSGISKLIEQTIDDKLVGVITLDEDVRSSTSKTFANLK